MPVKGQKVGAETHSEGVRWRWGESGEGGERTGAEQREERSLLRDRERTVHFWSPGDTGVVWDRKRFLVEMVINKVGGLEIDSRKGTGNA